MISPKTYKERRVYRFPCTGCGNPKATSFRRSRAKIALCRKCRKAKPDERQTALFADHVVTASDGTRVTL